MRRSLASRALSAGFRTLNRWVPWHRLPVPLGLLNLYTYREELREKNLFDTGIGSEASSGAPETGSRGPGDGGATVGDRGVGGDGEEDGGEDARKGRGGGAMGIDGVPVRSADGRHTDPACPHMGAAGTRFGRNVPLSEASPEEEPRLLEPNPRLVSRRLMTRDRFIPAEGLNLLAAAWIQFMTHDWFNHPRVRRQGPRRTDGPDPGDFVIPLDPEDPWPERPMRVPRTPPDGSCPAAGRPPAYLNEVSHWWDASSIYGSDPETEGRLRAFEDGKLVMREGRLPLDPELGVAVTGFNENWWVGLGLLHTLFSLEHNAICDRLRREYPGWSDDRLFGTAKLVNSALMAKIHTVEWTPGILPHPTLRAAMRGNWFGLAGERVKRRFGRISRSEALSGIPGSPLDRHGVPYSLTEEFTSVYRLHPLIPDEIRLRSLRTGETVRTVPFREVFGRRAAGVVGGGTAAPDVLYSFGVSHPGAITLHNFPRFLQDLELEEEGLRLDLATVDILRDRERGVPRYNRFRRLMHRRPVRSFRELTPVDEWAEELREVYEGDVDRVDLMVGMFAEQPPPGFGFSDTAFRVFILMASRRLKSDPFFTTHYRPAVYSPVGMEWIDDNGMEDVLLRHYPELEPALRGVENAFGPWNRV